MEAKPPVVLPSDDDDELKDLFDEFDEISALQVQRAALPLRSIPLCATAQRTRRLRCMLAPPSGMFDAHGVPRSAPVDTRTGDASDAVADLLRMYDIRYPAELAREFDEWPSIYMVPMELRRGDENKCYDPVAVQIGLCNISFSNMNHPQLQQLQMYKSCCVWQLVNRCCSIWPPEDEKTLLDGCFESMKRLYGDIRACYHRRIVLRSEMDVARTMLVDGCFTLHRLLKYERLERKIECSDDDWTQVGGRCFVWQLVTRDLLLLENQIPFFVLQELFDQLKRNDEAEAEAEAEGTLTIVRGSLMLFRSLCPQMLRCKDSFVSAIAGSDVQVRHLLHLFYLFVGFPDESRLPRKGNAVRRPRGRAAADVLPPSERPQWIPGVKELEEAGIRFRKRKQAATFLDIKFDFRSGVLEIPPLELYDYSEALFRNMIAFEQTYPGTDFDVSTYAVFMNCLITTREDMRILHLRGILTNMINGEQDASRFFNRICSQVHFPSDNYLVDVMDSVSKYKDSRRHQWRAALARDYFSNPWVAISVVAAVILLALTVLQTFFTVYPYFKPRN